MMQKIWIRLYALFEGVKIAFDSIIQNKVRAGLTILGIAVGLFVVTVMSAAVHGINEGVSSSLAAAGPTTFFISRWPAEINNCNGSANSCPWRHNKPLTVDQAKNIRALPSISGVTAHVSTSARIKYADRELPSVSIDAYSPEWFSVSGGDIPIGRNFTVEEYKSGAAVVLVNQKVVTKLFLGGEAVGKDVRIKGEIFRVIGVYAPIPSAFDSDQGKLIMPLTTARARLNTSLAWMDLTVKPRDGVQRDEAMDAVITLMRSTRHLRPASVNDFFISTPEKILELYNQIVGVFFLVMMVLSAIGLLVGGVGVIAIMMISVTERTREIGVRKALGATRATILWQFLVEAATLTTIGAIAGLAVGGLVTVIIRSSTPIKAATPPMAIVAALGCAAFAGILFGVLPAVRAARLDPVDALRYE
jgi:putative ABC transport system permease protein